ncbi:tetratricopeptide repeat protein [Paracidobacterium acidisoli]|uniref:Tetratricopeptide repeat protein n=1 Tax=Paracidobacterium acidisoli TaxID=2303751 RepID=A0A372ILE8_9BACT|nr:tetratricopeptide repeat protein [Paracidobacterium acidisoli]MBT9332373.1 tetratricopeptide repeat protein [Paracidobacterium acidisoli]
MIVFTRQAGYFLLISVLLCSASPSFAQADPVQQGVQLFRQGDYEDALHAFQAAKRAQPNNASLENLIGITETQLGHIENANKAYEAASRLNPKLADPHKNLAFNYLRAGQYLPAEQQLKSALALDRNDPAIHYYFVLVYLSTEQDRGVVSHLLAAEPFLKNDPQAAASAAKACLRSGVPDQAKQLIDLLENGSGFSIEQEYDLAKAFSDKGMYLDSAQRFRSVLKAHPESWESRYNLAISLSKANQTEEAIHILASLEAEHTKDVNVLSMVASAAESAGNSALALKALEDAIVVEPHSPDRYLDCTHLLMDLNRYDEAAEWTQRGIAQLSDPYPLTIRLGAIEMMRGNHDKAAADYQVAIQRHPEIALGYVALAQAYMKDGKDQEALVVLTDGRGKVPPDFALEYVFGLVSARVGKQAQAIDALVRAAQLNPQIVEPHYQLGVIFLQQEQLKKAQEEFESAIRIDPTHAEAYFQLSRVYARLGDRQKAQAMGVRAHELAQTQQEEAIKEEKSRLSTLPPQ